MEEEGQVGKRKAEGGREEERKMEKSSRRGEKGRAEGEERERGGERRNPATGRSEFGGGGLTSTVHKALPVTGHGWPQRCPDLRVLSPMSLPAAEKTPVATPAVRGGRQQSCSVRPPEGVWQMLWKLQTRRLATVNFKGCQSPGVLLLSGEGEGVSTWSSSFVDRFTAVQSISSG